MEEKIQPVLEMLRQSNPEIGHYVAHATTADFDYAVQLTNGRIIIRLEATQDIPNVLPEHLRFMLSSFQRN